MRALVVAVVALAACRSSTGLAPCNVGALAGANTSEGFTACGSFAVGDPNYTDEAMTAAQACVLNALAQKASFLLVYDAQDSSNKNMVTGNVAAAFVGSIEPGNQVLVREYAGEGRSGDMSMTSVSATTCATLVAAASCTPAVGLPCLTCTPLVLPNVVCRR